MPVEGLGPVIHKCEGGTGVQFLSHPNGISLREETNMSLQFPFRCELPKSNSTLGKGCSSNLLLIWSMQETTKDARVSPPSSGSGLHSSVGVGGEAPTPPDLI